MGGLLQADCQACGHRIEIYAGLGMSGYEFAPYLCRECGDIVDVAVEIHLANPDAPELHQCPDCGSANIKPLRDVSWGDVDADPSISEPCPKCGGSLLVTGMGDWD